MRGPMFAALLALLSGCQSCSPTETEVDPPGIPADDGGVVVVLDPDGEETVVDRPVTATLRTVGATDVAPRHVLVQFNQSVFEAERIGLAPEGLAFAIEPAIDGSLRVADTDLVEFTPNGGFPPDGTWTATVTSVQKGAETHTPQTPWSTTVTSPAFGLTDLRLRQRNLSTGRATLELVFSAPVRANDVATRLTLEVDGVPVAGPAVIQGEDHTALVEFRVGAAGAPEVTVDVAAGVPWICSGSLTLPSTVRQAKRAGAWNT